MKEAEIEQDGKIQTKLVAQGKGYPIGYKEGDQYYVVNHLNFWISYHDLEPNEEGVVLSRVVGLYLTATTVKVAETNKGSCEGGLPAQPATGDVTFTYSIKWVPSSIRWASRWDPLLEMDMQDKEMNWFAITNSLVITFCLSFMVAIILIRTLRRDVAMYNQVESLFRSRALVQVQGFRFSLSFPIISSHIYIHNTCRPWRRRTMRLNSDGN